MVEAIDPVTRKKKKHPMMVVPPPLVPEWQGMSVPYALAAALLESGQKVAAATNENLNWQREKHERGKKDDELRARIRNAHAARLNKNLSDSRVVIIQKP
jgi:hypothetical protein